MRLTVPPPLWVYLQELVDQFTAAEPIAQQRLPFFYCTGLPPHWRMEVGVWPVSHDGGARLINQRESDIMVSYNGLHQQNSNKCNVDVDVDDCQLRTICFL